MISFVKVDVIGNPKKKTHKMCKHSIMSHTHTFRPLDFFQDFLGHFLEKSSLKHLKCYLYDYVKFYSKNLPKIARYS